jgi:hypothetical protein
MIDEAGLRKLFEVVMSDPHKDYLNAIRRLSLQCTARETLEEAT